MKKFEFCLRLFTQVLLKPLKTFEFQQLQAQLVFLADRLFSGVELAEPCL
jgi:hypothetical protein